MALISSSISLSKDCREILAKAEELIALPLHGSQPQREAPIHHDDSQQDKADERWHDVAQVRMGYVVDSATGTGWVTKYRNIIIFIFHLLSPPLRMNTTVRNLTFHRHIASVSLSLAAHTVL